jgi:flagellar P-ring protein precursor FlgI
MHAKTVPWIASLVMAALAFGGGSAAAKTRIGDLGRVMGVRENPLVGYGLVIGLDGTGDRAGTGFTEQSMASLLEELGITMAPDELKLRNVAAVLVTADLPPFARQGSRIDVTVSSIGSAKDLRGGILVQTPLRGADANVYVVAQGPVSLGGFQVSGAGGSSVQKNHVTVGRIPSGGVVEREVPFDIFASDSIELVLDRPDFGTAVNIVNGINEAFGSETAGARDPGTISIPMTKIPEGLDAVSFAARIEMLEVDVSRPARVVVNERTGTIVAGGNVRIAPVAIAHGGLTIEVRSRTTVSQPAPFSEAGRTVVTPESDVAVSDAASVMAVAETTSLAELAEALNALGVSSSDVIAIFQALREAGALDADLVVI